MLDATDQLIVQALAADARLSLKDLASRAGMSSPAVSERLKRLEERGVIVGYAADIAHEPLGFALQAIVRVRPHSGRLAEVEAMLLGLPEVIGCDKVTGEDCFHARIVARTVAHLDLLVGKLAGLADTTTAIVKSRPLTRRAPPLAYRPEL